MEAKVGTEDYLAYMGQYKKDNFDELYDDACEKKKWDENNYKLKQKLKKDEPKSLILSYDEYLTHCKDECVGNRVYSCPNRCEAWKNN